MAWQNGKKFGGLWATNENRNTWVHVSGLGWRKLSNKSDSVTITMAIMAAHAKAKGSNVNFFEDGNKITQMYVW